MKVTDEICLKFPTVLREKLKNGEIELPNDVEFEYNPIHAFRAIVREQDDFSPICRKDFKSYAELGRKKLRGQSYDVSSPNYYGVSCFTNREKVELALHFPNPHKKLAEGYVYQEGGPQQRNDETRHVCWWLYENVDLSQFQIVKGE